MTLLKLDLNGCMHNDNWESSLASMLEKNTTLQRLNIENCNRTELGTFDIIQSLKSNSNIKKN